MKLSQQVFHVTDEQADLALSAALRAWVADASWSDVKRLIANRHVQINGNMCIDQGRRLKHGEVVKVLEHPAAPPPREDDVVIRFIDRHLVVVEKPCGMTTLRHPEERHWPSKRRQLQPTLDETLPGIIARREAKGRKPESGKKLRPVHRLDRETSGLMVFARNVDTERGLGVQFREHTLHRIYNAVVVGRVQERTIESFLVPDRGDGKRGSGPEEHGKRAVTHVRPLESLGDFTLVECRLETGRTHQIRIHMMESGHPVCGDKVYRGPYAARPITDSSGAPRLALHAAELGFVHPITGAEMKFTMPLPRELLEFISRLKQRARRAPSP